jgi:hypothetical protein
MQLLDSASGRGGGRVMSDPHHKERQMAPKPASSRQLGYLRRLADQTGQTFTYPTTAREASVEIDRLKNTPRQSRSDRRIEHDYSTDFAGPDAGGATRVGEDETVGYGSNATWAHNRQASERIISSHRPPRRMVGPKVGQRVELGRYTVPAGERVLYGQRVDGKVRVTDRPSGKVTAENRAHLIDNDLGSKAELDALVADYLAEAQRLQTIPAAAMPFDIALAELAAR